ncbi:MAG: choice-of-anchor Q domain-containing protein, partial [Anaerolineales bacterium]
GGAVYNEGSLLVRGSRLQENYSAGGGAIFNQVGGTAVIQGSSFLSNTVDNGAYGGAISNSGSVTITTSTFAGNNMTLLTTCPPVLDSFCGGGAIANLSGAVLDVSTTDFSRNSSNQNAGAILNKGGLRLYDSTLNDNRANSSGGLANIITATAYLTRVVISGNQAVSAAGLFNAVGSTMFLTDVGIRDNAATNDGGGFFNQSAVASLNRVTISGNSAGILSGGIENIDGATLTLVNSTLSGNSAGEGGGGMSNYEATVNLTHVTFSGNTAGNVGGGILNDPDPNSIVNLKNVLLVGNRYLNCGGQAPNTASFSLSTDTTCVAGGNGNHPNTPQVLGPLADNGGFTLTQLAAPGSEAVDHGSCIGGLLVDQRGLPRQVNGACDIGATERQTNDLGFFVWLPLMRR